MIVTIVVAAAASLLTQGAVAVVREALYRRRVSAILQDIDDMGDAMLRCVGGR